MNCKHLFKFIESSKVTFNYAGETKSYAIDKYKCIKCGKWYFIDKLTNKKVNLHNLLGEEV